MSDRIRECVYTKNSENNCIQYDIAYEVEDPNDVTHTNSFCVTIRRKEMNDPMSVTEAISLANLKAAEIKLNWLEMSRLTTHTELSVIGSVTL